MSKLGHVCFTLIIYHDKTKVNDLTSASEMVLKFIELHYVG